MNTPRCSHHETSLFGHVLRHVLTMRFLQDALLQGFLTLERVKGIEPSFHAYIVILSDFMVVTERNSGQVGLLRLHRLHNGFSIQA
jgi:hypothetical protein